MRKVKRFGISLEEELLGELDGLVRKHKFPNRSQAVRFLIRNSVIQEKWKDNDDVAGCVVLVYVHHKRELLSKLISSQHSFQDLVLSVQHVHLDHHNCLEMIAVKGKAMRLRGLADKLIALKGIKHGKLVMSGIEQHK